jgi:hypothetical protein
MNGWPDRVAGSSVGEAGRRSHKLVARTPELLGRAYFLGTFLVRYCAAVAQHSGIAKGDGLVRVECSLVSKPQNAEPTCLAHRGRLLPPRSSNLDRRHTAESAALRPFVASGDRQACCLSRTRQRSSYSPSGPSSSTNRQRVMCKAMPTHGRAELSRDRSAATHADASRARAIAALSQTAGRTLPMSGSAGRPADRPPIATGATPLGWRFSAIQKSAIDVVING